MSWPGEWRPTADRQQELKFISRLEVRDATEEEATGGASKTYTFTEGDMRKQEFGSIDANKDGKVSLDEYRARQAAMLTRGFEILDANGDKALSEAEYARIVAPPMPKPNVLGGPDAPEPPKVDIPGMKDVSPDAIKAAFVRLDGNKDGKLSLQEYSSQNLTVLFRMTADASAGWPERLSYFRGAGLIWRPAKSEPFCCLLVCEGALSCVRPGPWRAG